MYYGNANIFNLMIKGIFLSYINYEKCNKKLIKIQKANIPKTIGENLSFRDILFYKYMC